MAIFIGTCEPIGTRTSTLKSYCFVSFESLDHHGLLPCTPVFIAAEGEYDDLYNYLRGLKMLLIISSIVMCAIGLPRRSIHVRDQTASAT